MDKFEVIVVGVGHAGIEAALASSRMGCKTLLLTMNLDTVAQMSCNPAIGGLAKGQLVKEIDALGGEMAKATDFSGIQFRILNASKGPAVRSSRAQVDRALYRSFMKKVLENQEGLFLRQAIIERMLIKNKIVYGVETSTGEKFFAQTVVVAPGTFLNGLIHIGLTHYPAGRLGDIPSFGLAKNLKELGFRIARFKTGTCPRLDGRTINFKKLKPQYGDDPPQAFSFAMGRIIQRQAPCYLTYTNPKTHKIIRSGLSRSPLYTGIIKAIGVRYCPSIEDKVVKFPDRDRHQVFLEPEGLDTNEYYPNGLATSLPSDVQIEMLHSIEGLENVEITRPGYGIEHDMVDPTQLYPWLETRLIKNLFLAGQINGTTGYEEAAAQGLIAGINSALRTKRGQALFSKRGLTPFVLGRDQAYIGVLIDDLVTKGTNEPYRMFTSRCEYRLILREDNADIRLGEMGYKLGLIDKKRWEKIREKKEGIRRELKRIKEVKVKAEAKVNSLLKKWQTSPLTKVSNLEELLKRPQIDYNKLRQIDSRTRKISPEIFSQVEIETKYAGYIRRQEEEIKRMQKIEKIKIPETLDYARISGFSREIKEKLSKFRPLNLGQASRISGITPAAISILMVYLRKVSEQKKPARPGKAKRTGETSNQ
jgi:tRNA uridine 5-carboxymethylaminomethyl modification enzyme